MSSLLSIEIPTEAFEKSRNLSLDFGSSVIKTAFIQREGASEGTPSAKTKLILKSFSREDRDAGARKGNKSLLQEVKGHFSQHGLFETRTDTKLSIGTTGVGVSQMVNDFQDVFQTSVNNLNEMHCAVRALISLGMYLPEMEMCHLVEKPAPPPATRINTADIFSYAPEGSKTHKYIQKCKGLQKEMSSSDQSGTTSGSMEKPLITAENEDLLFPALYVICGSATIGIRVESDGSFQHVMHSSVGGHTLLSMTSLLTGVTNYEDIEDLASQGDTSGINAHMQDVMPQKSGDTYQNLLKADKDILIFAFSKAYRKSPSEFRKEDLIKSYMEAFADILTGMSRPTALAYGCKSVFFGGGVCNSAVLRDYIATMFCRRDRSFISTAGDKLKLYFPKYAQYFGAIGALLLDADNI